MIVRDIKKDVIGISKEVFAKDGQWLSRRMLLKDDGMGFSFHETIIKANTKTHIHYQNHLEAVYCVAGNGKIEDLKTGVVHEIYDGVMYALNNHDEHYLYGGNVLFISFICSHIIFVSSSSVVFGYFSFTTSLS